MGLGCMVLTSMYGSPDQTEATATFGRALELGITLFDTADVYADGANELAVGRLCAPHRSQIALASKVGLLHIPDPLSASGGQRLGVDARPERIRSACEASLRRLRTDYLDIYYLHRVDPGIPIGETVGAMAELVQAGLVRYLGLCEVTETQLRAAYAAAPIAVVQSEWSLWARRFESDCLSAARELEVGVVPYGPLGRGVLTGTISAKTTFNGDDVRLTDPRFSRQSLDTKLGFLDILKAVAARHDATLGQIALAWLSAQGDEVVPIPGTERRSYLEENVGSLQIQLDQADLDEIDGALSPDEATQPSSSIPSAWAPYP
jgi:aryl-alcohol dehydrogenase-like predicted oxidoreductase